MDIKQLRYFCVVAEEGQVTKAAKKLHMAQPPLSQQIKNIEKELGSELFEREGRSLVLTEPGRVLYKKAKKILQELEDTVLEVQETKQGIRGTLSIGSNKSCFSYLPEQLKRLRSLHPQIAYQLREGDTSFLAERVINRDIELALVRLPVDLEKFSILRLPSEPYVLVTPVEWPTFAPDIQRISMKELKELPLMLLHRISGTGQFELIVSECRNHGFEPQVICECPDASMLISLAAAGVGATIVPKSTLYGFPNEQIRVLELEDANIAAELGIIWNKDHYLTKSAQRLLELFKGAYPHTM
ncbi:LysR family transcriptional regulator [Bacillus piscicola]|uniref:LysR family transcriptional regulator n=1 Tax=Bacillus piscicola TaxID=1632684 RepID=UPI001F08B442|nr:LysR family transcriptional regulator [Bacillus piscicola]